MLKIRHAIPVLAATAAFTAGLAPTASAASGPAETATRSATVTSGSPVDHANATVVHFGYDGKNTYQSPILDGADPKAADPANWLPGTLAATAGAGKNTAAPAQPSAVGFVCSLWVGKVILTGTLEAGTEQTCTGAFSEQYTVAWFERSSWSGWRSMTTSGTGPATGNQVNDSTFRVSCNTGGGTYDYRLRGTPMARSSEDGRLVAGPTLTGETGRYTCGT
ncbi:hypothetical protein [Kitasatospora griseola]|uniref:hypothetical protein n=1 Tax=Kitasatospora griseola TaxID=2064 RepID=UPI003828D9DB